MDEIKEEKIEEENVQVYVLISGAYCAFRETVLKVVYDLTNDHQVGNNEYSKEELDALFDKDFDTACDQAIGLVGSFNICEDALGVVIEMVFQLGIGGVSKFKNMLEALRESDYANAAVHILASNWHKQTPKRCEELAEVLRTCADIN